jgi:hypothetical protein
MTHAASNLKLIGCLLVAWFVFALPLQAQSTDTITLLTYWLLNSTSPPAPANRPTPARPGTSYAWSVAANANVDECFHVPLDDAAAIAASNASFFTAYPNDLSTQAVTDCLNGYPETFPKINQGYVWGLTANGREIWFSTVANTLCLVLDSFYGATPAPVQTNDYVCNYQNNPAEDFKPPRMYVYNAQTKTLTDLTPNVYGDPNLIFGANYVFGLRSAGTDGSVVFFGGLNLTGNVVMFAFNASTHAYLGSYRFDGTTMAGYTRELRRLPGDRSCAGRAPQALHGRLTS